MAAGSDGRRRTPRNAVMPRRWPASTASGGEGDTEHHGGAPWSAGGKAAAEAKQVAIAHQQGTRRNPPGGAGEPARGHG